MNFSKIVPKQNNIQIKREENYMKKANGWIGLLYIIIAIGMILLTYSGARDTYILLTRIDIYINILVFAIALIIGLINVFKGEMATGIFTILGIVAFVGYLLIDLPILVIAEGALLIISGIFILILKKNYENSESVGAFNFFCFMLLILNIAIITYPTVLAFQNIFALKAALQAMQDNNNQETYIYKATTGETVFMNIDGQEINRRLFDTFDYKNYNNGFKYNLQLESNKIIGLSDASIKNKIHFIDSKGETIFVINAAFSTNVGELFIKHVLDNNLFGIKQAEEDVHKNIYASYFDKVTEYNKNSYEDGCDFSKFEKDLEDGEEYIYFRNNELVIQVINTIDLSEDRAVIDEYSKFNQDNAKYYDRNSEKIEEFYRTKKRYTLINLDKQITAKMECDNLIYEALNDGNERILAYRNRWVPFYDSDKVGYITEEGKTIELTNDYVIRSVNDKYMLIYEKSAEKNYVYSTDSMDELKEISRLIYTYDSIAVSYSLTEMKGIHLLDQNYEYIDTFFNEPTLVGHHIIGYDGGNSYLSQIYFYNDGVVFKIEDIANQFISANSMHYNATGNHIFESIGIIK